MITSDGPQLGSGVVVTSIDSGGVNTTAYILRLSLKTVLQSANETEVCVRIDGIDELRPLRERLQMGGT